MASSLDADPAAIYSVTLDDLLRRPSWHAQAACRGMGPDAFFEAAHEAHDAAVALCGTCPVREPCAEAGASERFGVWAGTSPRERQERRRAARRAG